ncbi:hypothetical protein HAX54_043560 [Datura stramonium]|uniref:Uncharacterized protein n=1 Tax=Datura stramonium TaxID=4076 RepID=A0ABS8SN99_DATST|nr:hypothetical protein [Datura stramonium]
MRGLGSSLHPEVDQGLLRQSMSPTAFYVSSSHSHDRTILAHSKGSVASSGDDLHRFSTIHSFRPAQPHCRSQESSQNMFRPLLSSVPSSTFYAGKASTAHHSCTSETLSQVAVMLALIKPIGLHDNEGRNKPGRYRCGQWYCDTESLDGDLKLCPDCVRSEVQLHATPPLSSVVGENSPETLTSILENRPVDGFELAGNSHDSL